MVYLLNRGGRFQNHRDAYEGDMVTNAYAAGLNIYQEKTAAVTHSGTGLRCPGYATYVPIQDYAGQEPRSLREGYELALITNRTISQCKSRTITNPWLTPIMPENAIQVNPADARRLGLRDGQQVRVVSATNQAGEWPLGNGRTRPMVGRVQVTEQVRPALSPSRWGSATGPPARPTSR